MDAVNAFNMELFSMIDMKPPISRAKMMSVTKSAIKAIKLYKHVVQIVEKFIKKCKPELKVPGLYVVDSIVRQSRHQFGVEKDVFGPRFLKNFTDTFLNLYHCSEDDKTKILRVLNLWEKNGVFDMDIIQPLMDMCNGTIVPAPALQVVSAVPQLPTPDALAAVAQLFQSPHGLELQRMLQNFQQADKTRAASITNTLPNPAQPMPVAQLNPYNEHTENRNSLAEKLLDRFDYDDEPEDVIAKEGSAQTQSPKRRRSRSSSRSRRPRHRRSNSRSKEQHLRSRSGSQDRNEREKDRERRQKGLPSIKSQTLSVCSTTLWVGQLDKKTQQPDVMSLLEEFGQIDSINMIPPRGCAYIAMVHRQDANTALTKLSRGSYKVNQKPVKIAWALNKGIKSAHKKFWDVERGVTYIPWNKVKVDELETYREGGMLDVETLNTEWNYGMDINNKAAVNGDLESVPAEGTVTDHIQVPQVLQAAPITSPPAFPGPIMLSPTGPPVGAPFIPTEFDPTKLAPAGNGKPPEESTMDSKGDKGEPSDLGADIKLGSPTAPMMTLPGPGVMQGPRPGMPPMQPPPGMPNHHLPPFLSPPNMPPMPPHMMPGGPMFPPNRFRMHMPFPPRGPPFHRPPPMGPEGMNDTEGRHFRNGRAGFGCPPFIRGRW
ncbi:hypothetical protein F7725_020495 [Dissostichus mawsoni]|uniref:Uncharacterized protein n=1 Tax=Dissostichus mawsoni TaxID=36200 RepID=A0A7J5YFZ8_DISMA|nr:hypothetical protein F7725_020495 [Dissostichus mawsoni]